MLRIVIGQSFEERSHGVSVRRSSGKRGIECLRQSAITPAKLLRRRRHDFAVVSGRLIRGEAARVG